MFDRANAFMTSVETNVCILHYSTFLIVSLQGLSRKYVCSLCVCVEEGNAPLDHFLQFSQERSFNFFVSIGLLSGSDSYMNVQPNIQMTSPLNILGNKYLRILYTLWLPS